MLKSEQLEKLANAYLKAARDKRISAAKHGVSGGGRTLAEGFRKLEDQKHGN